MNPSAKQRFLRYVGQTSDFPLLLEIDRAEGVFLYTSDGKPYYDLVSGVAVSSVGHGNPDVIAAIRNQLDHYTHLMVYGEMVQSPQVEYAEWLVGHLPASLDNVYYVNSGSEAIEGAMKLAKRVTGRHDIVAFRNAYHGSTHGAVSIMGDESFHRGFLPLLPGITHIDFNEPDQLDLITERTACVVVEPIQAEAGIIEPQNDFMSLLRQRCDQTGALLVLDEIQTGLGRTGKWFAFEHYGIVPDILCLAKSFGGGLPLGAFISNAGLMKELTHDPPLGHITTFGGHPLSCAAGFAAMRYIEKHALHLRAEKVGMLYRNYMQHSGIQRIRGKGLFLAVEFSPQVDAAAFMEHALAEGVVLDQFLFCRNAFRIAPPLTITDDEVAWSSDRLLKAIDRSLK